MGRDTARGWLAAERDVFYSPPGILTETRDKIQQTAVPCVDAKSLQVDLMLHSLTIEGQILRKRPRRGEKIHLCESGGSSSYGD